jgi:hypothetical protein
MAEAVNKIEDHLTRLKEELQKGVTYLNELDNAIKKLRNDRIISQKNIDTINGAIQAYAESVRLINEKPQG